jgi:flavin-dependent dehydrogenase
VGAERHDVAIIGAGIAGLAASVLLRHAGMRVLCMDARPYPHNKVGESLDWSSPGLLQRVGIDPDALLADGIATCKKKIVVCELGKTEWQAAPPPVIRRSPLRFETVTLHVDRRALDARLYEHACALGTEFLWERVTGVGTDGDRIVECSTASGRRIDAKWYLDASGTARVLSRAMRIPTVAYGQPKVCLWTYFDTPPLHDGTAFFVDNDDGYLSWVWDIPISPRQTSVGFVLPAQIMRDGPKGDRSVEALLRQELLRHPRFRALVDSTPVLDIERTSFQPYVTSRVCGDNWFMVGEAASMPDPLTGNGVTSGIRHARHATSAILVAAASERLSRSARRTYAQHVSRLGHSFNAHIEDVIYRHPIRWGLGLQAATYIYTLFAFFMNALHARFDPRGRLGMSVFSLLFLAARGWIAGWTLIARTALWYRGLRARPAAHAGTGDAG